MVVDLDRRQAYAHAAGSDLALRRGSSPEGADPASAQCRNFLLYIQNFRQAAIPLTGQIQTYRQLVSSQARRMSQHKANAVCGCTQSRCRLALQRPFGLPP
jgi:hypothetical protein